MTSKSIAVLAALLASSSLSESAPTPDLSSRILEVSEVAADVSQIVYATPEEQQDEYEGYDSFEFYTDNIYPNQFAVARKDGRCYLGFRGTTETL